MQAVSSYLLVVSYLAQALGIVAAGDEFRHCRLYQPRLAIGKKGLDGGCRFHKFVGEHHVAQAQSDSHGLRKGPQIDEAPPFIEGRQHRQRRILEAEVAIVIIFQDVSAARCGPFEQCMPAFHRQDVAQRILVRRRDVDKGGALRGQSVDLDPFLVDRDPYDPGAKAFEHVAGALVAGGFGNRRGGWLKEQSRGDGECFLDSGGNDHLPRIGPEAAGPREVVGRDGRHEGAPGLRGDQVALGNQLLVCQFDGIEGNTELSSHFPDRSQTRSGPQVSVRDQLPQLSADLVLQRVCGPLRDV